MYDKLLIETPEVPLQFNAKTDNILLINRLTFLAKSIKQIVGEVIGISPPSNSYIGMVEGSCCMEDADKFINYYFSLSMESDKPLHKYIEESLFLANYLKYYIQTGAIHQKML